MTKLKIKIPAQEIEFEIETTGGDDPVIITPPPPPVDNTGFKVGVNSFPWFPLRLLKGIGMQWARVYCSSGWIWQPGGLFIEPMFRAETVENHGIDSLLIKAKENGVNILLTIHQCPEWLRNTGRGDGANDFPPIKAGAKRDDPASYKEYASFLFQIAARYGRVKHPDSVLKIDTTARWSGDIPNVKKTGLDILNFVECWNESDKFWLKGTDAYFTPEETAAMMSACYDGHEGTLGAGVGIITADPSMQVIMPALTDFDIAYIDRMDTWFENNRVDKSWPCSIFSIHHYSNKGNKKGQHPAQWQNEGACLPKDDANFETISTIVNFANLIKKKCWLSECGADKVAPSAMLAKGVGKSNEQFQSDIILASIAAYKAAGVDAVFVFNGPDENSGIDGGQFESSGIWSSEAAGYRPFIAADELKRYLAVQQPKQKVKVADGASSKAVVALHKASAFKRPK